MKEVKIILSPFTHNVEIVENFIIKIGVDYSDTEVNVTIDPNIQAYEEKKDGQGIELSQFIVSKTKDTKDLKFNLEENKVHDISIDGRNFEIKLQEIGSEKVEEIYTPKFKFFIFIINEKEQSKIF